jgi:hypothetical protein
MSGLNEWAHGASTSGHSREATQDLELVKAGAILHGVARRFTQNGIPRKFHGLRFCVIKESGAQAAGALIIPARKTIQRYSDDRRMTRQILDLSLLTRRSEVQILPPPLRNSQSGHKDRSHWVALQRCACRRVSPP